MPRSSNHDTSTSPKTVTFPRPPAYSLSLAALLSLPKRLFNPPPKPNVRISRQWSLKPIYHISLQDMLEKKHLAPLGLKDFEEYLIFTERSVENLYFIMWLREYTRNYALFTQSKMDIKLHASINSVLSDGERNPVRGPIPSPSYLTISWFRARATFLDPTGPLELNLPSRYVTELVCFAAGARNLPPPSAFHDVKLHIEELLTESLSRFVNRSCGRNSGPVRKVFALSGAASNMILGIAPIAVGIALDYNRWIRICGAPFLWFGLVGLICGLQGMCIFIFMFGDARQLYPYELARPTHVPTLAVHSSHNRLSASASRFLEIGITPPPSVYIPSSPTKTHLSLRHQNSYDNESLKVHTHPPIVSASVLPISKTDGCEGIIKAANASSEDLESHISTTPNPYALRKTIGSVAHNNRKGLTITVPGSRSPSPSGRPFSPTRRSPTYPPGILPSVSDSASPSSPPAIVPLSPTLRSPSYSSTLHRSSNSIFDFDSLPEPFSPNTNQADCASIFSRSSRNGVIGGRRIRLIFAPWTKVMSDVVKRNNWEVVVRAMAVSVMITFVVEAVGVGVPAVHGVLKH